MIIRGCDVRKWGKSYVSNYIVDNQNLYDVPIEKFVCCPPWKVNLYELGISQQGMRIIERSDLFGNPTGVYDLWDYIGHTGYPYAVDFIEEARRFGTSRLIPKSVIESAEFKLLDPAISSHIMIHDKALLTVESAVKLQENRLDIHSCPAGVERHNKMTLDDLEPCMALDWECVEETSNPRTARRWWVPMPRIENPTFAYQAATSLTSWNIQFDGSAVFMIMPLSKATIDVIEDPLEHKEVDALKLLAEIESQFPYRMVQE